MTTTSVRRRAALALSAGALGAVLAACGGSGGDGSASGTVSAPPAASQTEPAGPANPANPVTRVTAELSDFHIALSRQSFTPGAYDVVVTNTGHHDHALEFDGPGGESRTKTLAPGAAETLRVVLKAGDYEVYCPVDGHQDLGMKTKVTVAAGSTSRTPTDQTPSAPSGGGY